MKLTKLRKNLESINAINTDFKKEFDEFNEEISDLLIEEIQKKMKSIQNTSCCLGRRLPNAHCQAGPLQKVRGHAKYR